MTALLILLGAALAIVAWGAIYQARGLARDARRFPPPGRVIDGLHLKIDGAGSPPVVLEAGIGATSLSWGLIEAEIARSAQVIAYDRAGLGWSDAIATPRVIATLVDELRAMLAAARIETPRVIVGHSFGGFIALAYAARFPDEVAGMVLLDPPGIGEWARPSGSSLAMLRRGAFMAGFGGLLARVGLVRFALNSLSGGGRALPKLIARGTSGGAGAGFIERMVGQVRKLPAAAWPMVQAHWCDPKCFQGIARQLRALPECAAWIEQNLERIRAPFVLLSAADASAAQRAEHDRLVRRLPNGRLEIVERSGHWIQLDRPDAVTDAIARVIAACPRV